MTDEQAAMIADIHRVLTGSLVENATADLTTGLYSSGTTCSHTMKSDKAVAFGYLAGGSAGNQDSISISAGSCNVQLLKNIGPVSTNNGDGRIVRCKVWYISGIVGSGISVHVGVNAYAYVGCACVVDIPK